jgi:DNA-binding NarL/FixJ family response regulator
MTPPLQSAEAVAAPVVVIVARTGAMRDRITQALGRPGVLALPDAGPDCASVIDADMLVLGCERIGAEELTQLRHLRDRRPDLRIVVVCATASVRYTRRAIDCGAHGFVLTELLWAALAPTVAAVLAGQCAVPGQFGTCARRQSLSFREKQILGLAAAGYTNAQICAELFLAESTVKSHLSAVFTKLGVASRNEAASLILDSGEPPELSIAGLPGSVGGLAAPPG